VVIKVPRVYCELSPLMRLAIECLKNRAEFSLKADTLVRNLADEYGWAYPEVRNYEKDLG